jgi:small-conductance mechanosensitive channel
LDVARTLKSLAQWLETEPLGGFLLPAVKILVVILLAWAAFRLIRRGLNLLEGREIVTPAILLVLRMILKWIVVVFGLLLALQQAGVSLNNLWTTISAVLTLIAVGFVAVWSILSNFLCTLMLLIFQPFRIGDEIEIIDPALASGISGKVVNINMMFTLIRETDGGGRETGVIQIPNNQFFQKFIRRKAGRNSVNLNEQIFEAQSLAQPAARDARTDSRTD